MLDSYAEEEFFGIKKEDNLRERISSKKIFSHFPEKKSAFHLLKFFVGGFLPRPTKDCNKVLTNIIRIFKFLAL